MNINQIQDILNKQKNGESFSFEELKPFLKVQTKDCYWEFDYEEHFREYLPSWCCNYSNLDHDKVNEMFKDVKVYTITSWLCTDTTVGEKVAEYKDRMCFSIDQQYRKNGTFLRIHNEEVFKEFIRDLESCHTPDDYDIQNITPTEFNTKNIVFVYEHNQGENELFMDDSGIIRKVVKTSRVPEKYFHLEVVYLVCGKEIVWQGDVGGRFIGTTINDQDFKDYLVDKNIFDLLGSKVYSQYGNSYWDLDKESK